MKKNILLIALLVIATISAQNKKIIYGFDKIPQVLLLNPGAETTYKYHIGVPLLSGVSASFGSSGAKLADVFRDDNVGIFGGTDFTTKLTDAISKLKNDDYVHVNSQIEVLNGGYKINDSDYLSAGFYIEADGFATTPKDIGVLLTEGNAPYVGKSFSVGDVALKAEVVGVLHVGLSRRFNDRLTAGGRFKLYSGSTNVTSTGNSGSFITEKGGDNIYIQTLSGLDFSVNTSGVYDENNETNLSAGSILGGSFFGGNFGVGLDLGFTFHVDEQSEITGSLLDFGFVSYSKNLRNVTASGNYTFSGVEFKYDSLNKDYWKDLENDFDQKVPRKEDKESYTIMRPIKAYGSYGYSWGRSKSRTNCHDNTYKDFFDNTVGGQIFAVTQPQGINLAYTAFYQRKLSKYLNLKATYTVDDFSYSNIGLGASMNIWKINIYGAVGNIFGITDVADTNTFSSQLGINFIMN